LNLHHIDRGLFAIGHPGFQPGLDMAGRLEKAVRASANAHLRRKERAEDGYLDFWACLDLGFPPKDAPKMEHPAIKVDNRQI
jgi:hypothetical protein